MTQSLMFIAHAPAGYLLVTSLLKHQKIYPVATLAIIAACMFGAIAPDLDLIYFFLIDERQHPHRTYITHWPITWLLLLLLSLIISRIRQSKLFFLTQWVCIGALSHLVLDTIFGKIWWFAPFIDRPYVWIEIVPHLNTKYWIVNLVLHVSFLLEIIICIWAGLRWNTHRQSYPQIYTSLNRPWQQIKYQIKRLAS